MPDDHEIDSALQALPDISVWEHLSADERAHRESVLFDIARRIQEEGPYVPKPDPSRGRIFLPFAALKDPNGQKE